EVQRRRVEPLQVIEKQRERMFWPREDAEKPPEYPLEAVLRVLRRQLRHRWLWANDELEFGNHIDHELPVLTERVLQRLPPCTQLGITLAQQWQEQVAEGLRQGGIRDVTLILVELPRREEAARRHERLVQFVHYRGLADTGVARHQHEF